MSLRRIIPLIKSIRPIRPNLIKPIKIHARPIFTTKGLIATTAIFAVGVKRPDILYATAIIIIAAVMFVYFWALASAMFESGQKQDKECDQACGQIDKKQN